MVNRLRSTLCERDRWYKDHHQLPRNGVQQCTAYKNVNQAEVRKADTQTTCESLTQLRQAYQHLLQNQEAEKRALAHELHDETLQQLADISVRIGLMKTQHTADIASLDDLQARLAHADYRLREIVRGVHPAVLVDLGLVEAIISFLESLTIDVQSRSIRIMLSISGFGQDRLPDQAIELTLYRFVQNAVANALRHAQPEHIDIKLIWRTERIEAYISDDGCGMQQCLSDAIRAGRFGLLSMRERVLNHGGTFDLNTASGEGTQVIGSIPLAVDPPDYRKTETYVLNLSDC